MISTVAQNRPGAPVQLPKGLLTHCMHACMHAEEGSRESCDSHCRKLTASWVREAKASNPNIETCQYYEGLDAAGAEGVMDPGVYAFLPSSSPLFVPCAPGFETSPVAPHEGLRFVWQLDARSC